MENRLSKWELPKWLNRLADDANMGVSVSIESNGFLVAFSGYTSQGQDVEEEFDVKGELTKDKLLEEIKWFVENWDSEEKADIWCVEEEEENEDGDWVMVKHGSNGAPYNYEDVVADMDEYRDMFKGMCDSLEKSIEIDKRRKGVPTKVSITNGDSVEIRYFPSINLANKFAKGCINARVEGMTESEIIANHTALHQFEIQRKHKRLRKKYTEAFGMIL